MELRHHHPNGEVYQSDDSPIQQSFRVEQVARMKDAVFWCKNANPTRIEHVLIQIHEHKVLVGALVTFRSIIKPRKASASCARRWVEHRTPHRRANQRRFTRKPKIAST